MTKIHALLLCCILATAPLAGCSKTDDGASSAGTSTAIAPSTRAGLGDLDFAKSSFNAMLTGDASVESDIDWDNFTASGQDVGTPYNKASTPQEKAAFRRSFLSSFASSFQKTGATANSFTNWRVTGKDELPGQVIVIADAPNGKHLQVTTQKVNGQPKLLLIGVG